MLDKAMEVLVCYIFVFALLFGLLNFRVSIYVIQKYLVAVNVGDKFYSQWYFVLTLEMSSYPSL